MGQAASPSLYDFCGGDPINRFDRDGRCPNLLQSFEEWWSTTFGDKAPLAEVNKFFDSHPQNHYLPDPTAVPAFPSMDDPNSPPQNHSVILKYSATQILVNGIIDSAAPIIQSANPDGEIDNADPTKSTNGENGNPSQPRATGPIAVLNAGNAILSGQVISQNSMSQFAFVYNNDTGGWYMVNVSAVQTGGHSQYVPPSQAPVILNVVYSNNNIQLSANAKSGVSR